MRTRATNVSRRRAIGIGLAIIGLISVFLGRERSRTAELRAELDAARRWKLELTQLESENRRLRAQRIPAAELERLRADHAALPRLRAEVEQLERLKSDQQSAFSAQPRRP